MNPIILTLHNCGRYRDTGMAKLKEALGYLDDLIEKGTKALLFAHHQDVLDGAYRWVPNRLTPICGRQRHLVEGLRCALPA